jgi:hypothetical protein
MPVPSEIMAALSFELRRLEALAARLPDPDYEDVERLVPPAREALRQLGDELDRRR